MKKFSGIIFSFVLSFLVIGIVVGYQVYNMRSEIPSNIGFKDLSDLGNGLIEIDGYDFDYHGEPGVIHISESDDYYDYYVYVDSNTKPNNFEGICFEEEYAFDLKVDCKTGKIEKDSAAEYTIINNDLMHIGSENFYAEFQILEREKIFNTCVILTIERDFIYEDKYLFIPYAYIDWSRSIENEEVSIDDGETVYRTKLYLLK